MAVIDALYEYFGEIINNLNVNYLSPMAKGVSIEVDPGERVIRKYIDGGELRELPFTIALREDFGEDVEKNLEVQKFFENLRDTIAKNNREGIVPLGEDFKAITVEAVTHGYVATNTLTMARYQMECKFCYKVRGY